MYRNVLLGGVTAAAIIGAGGAALAVTGSDTTPGSPTSSAATSVAHGAGAKAAKAGKAGKTGKAKLLRRLAHGQIVTRGKGGVFVTHDLIRGTVTAVSATSITVQAADKVTETFAVTKDTKVRVRSAGTSRAASISDVAKGDRVGVAGVGASTFTARHIVDAHGAK